MRVSALTTIFGSTLGLTLASACQDFVDPELGVCGNRIIESDEDCDDPSDPRCGPSCRVLCDPRAEQPDCPALYLCGSDGVCRTPSGAFSSDAVRIDEEGARWIAVGDLDGDLRDDLVIQFDEPDLKLAYYDPSSLTSVFEFLEPLAASVAVADLTGDGRAELFVAPEAISPDLVEPALLSVWRGTSDRTFSARHFATVRTEGTDARLLALTPAPDRIVELVDASTTRRWSSRAPEPSALPPVGLAGTALGIATAVADLDGGQCEGEPPQRPFSRNEIAFGLTGSAVVPLATTCGDEAGIEFLSEVALPAGVRMTEAGTFFVDANADDRLDLVVQGDDERVYLAYGVGDASFHSDPIPPTPSNTPGDARFDPNPLLTWTEGQPGRLLAVADFDQDDQVEVVTHAHYFAAPESCAETKCAVLTWPRPLLHATVADINDDGVPDLASIDDDILTLRLADPLREVAFEAHERELSGTGRHLVVGDFNRDTIADLAFVEASDDAHLDAEETITIFHGGPIGAWAMEHFGPFGEVQDLVVDHGTTLVARLRDEQGKISGAFIEPDEPRHDFGLAVREPVAVRVADQTAIASVVARPSDDTESLGLFGFVGGGLSPHDIHLGDSLGIAPGAGIRTLAVAVDADVDGTDELLVLGTHDSHGQVWLARLGDDRRWRQQTTFATGPGFVRPLVDAMWAEQYPTPGDGPGSTAAVGDVDGDGDPDVIATTDEALPRVVVLRNDAGTFSPHATVFLASVTSPAFEFAHIEPWHPDSSGAQRWLVAGEDGVALAEVDLPAGEIRLDERFEVRTAAIATADLNGNGLLDLVLATHDQVRIHLAAESIGAAGPR